METLPAKLEFSTKEVQLIKDTVAKNLSDTEFGFLMHMAQTYRLDPFTGEIWAVKYGAAPARVFAGKNGFLKVAHDSGQLDGIKTGWRKEGDEVIGWAEVRRRDAANPFYVEVLLSEYKREYKPDVPKEHRIWEQKPVTMIQKVALVHALRLAFTISGLYAPEEFGEVEKSPMKDVTPGKTGPLDSSVSTKDTRGGGSEKGSSEVIDADQKQAEAEAPLKGKRYVKKGKEWYRKTHDPDRPTLLPPRDAGVAGI